MTKPTTKPRASITMPTCPHCEQASGYRKQAGHYHEMEHDGKVIKLFYVKCKACDGSYTLREVWPVATPDPGANAQISFHPMKEGGL